MSSFPIPLNARIVINQIELPPSKQDEEHRQGDSAESYEDDGQGNHDLPDEIKTALKSLLTHYGSETDRHARRLEVIETRRQRFYDRGYQYIYFNWGSLVFLPITAGVVMSAGSDSVMMPRYCNVYNIYKPYRRNFSATLAQNAPGVIFEPSDPTSSLDIKIAQAAEKYAEHYDHVNDRRKLQSKIGRLFWTDGRIVAVTRHEKNAEKFGTYQDQESERDYQEDRAQNEEASVVGVESMAVETGGEEQDNQPGDHAARGEEITRLYGVLEAKVFPISATDQDELTAVIISDDPDLQKAKHKYPWIADDIKAGSTGTGETAFERNARLGILQGTRQWTQSSDSYSYLSERQQMYLRPAAYYKCDPEVRRRLNAIFPKGIRVMFVSGEYAESYNASMDDELVVDHALEGDGMNRPSWGRDMMPVQDAYNNYRNYRQEIHDYGAPWTAYDTALFDGQAMREKIAQPGEFVGVVNPNPNTPISQYFFRPPADSPPGDMIEAEQDLRDALSQLISGVQPALFGGAIANGADADTVGVYQMAREQAMGVMALPWGTLQSMYARFKYQAVLAAASNRRTEDRLTIAKKLRGGRKRPISIAIGDLQKGNFRAVPDTDSSFPATRSMKKQALMEFFAAGAENPVIAEATVQPDNLELAAQMEGLAELDIPAAKAWVRQMDEIDQLLEMGPIPPTRQQVEQAAMMAAAEAALQASAAGQVAPPLPPEMQPPTERDWADPDFLASGGWLSNKLMRSLAKCSVEVDEDDYHNYHLQAIKNWKNSDERDRQLDAGNRAGLANLDLHRDLHKKFLEQEQAKAQAQAQSQTQNQPPVKPPSQSMNFKDLPPEGKIQMAAEAGIKLNPQGMQG